MPSVSRAQHAFVAVEASKGKKWAEEWLHADKGKVGKLPKRNNQRIRKSAAKRMMGK